MDCDRCQAYEPSLCVAATIMEQLHNSTKLSPDPGWPDKPPTDEAQLWGLIRHLQQNGYRLILLLDNLDRLLASAAQPASLYELLHRVSAEATLVVTAEQPLYDIHSTLSEVTRLSSLSHLFLGLIEPEAATQWLSIYQRQFPALVEISEPLLEFSGRHPFLLHKLGDSLTEVQAMLSPTQTLRPDQLPLIRLRLAEHGRPLFAALWQNFQHPPPLIAAPVVLSLVEQLLEAPLTPAQLRREQLPALNWLINQATIAYRETDGEFGYHLFSPLFADFLADRRATVLAAIEPSRTLERTADHDLAFYEQLTKVEATLLRYFQRHSQALISTDQLLAEVWKRPQASNRRVQEAIRRLRLQLEQQTPPIGEIKNERGRGYRFVPAPKLDKVTR
jgi:hypothetical protein